MAEKILFSWSGGKDSAMALYELRKNATYDVEALLATITEDYDRISMHGTRRVLLEEQAKSLDLSLEKIFITKNAPNEEYEYNMHATLKKYKLLGFSSVGFGDIFLEDVKKYREKKLSEMNMRGLFPLWKKDTKKLVHEFIGLGFKAIVTCVDTTLLDKSFIGRTLDNQFVSELPEGVDPCGENGEFHSFVYDGPVFYEPVQFSRGEIVLRNERFLYCDLLSALCPSGQL